MYVDSNGGWGSDVNLFQGTASSMGSPTTSRKEPADPIKALDLILFRGHEGYQTGYATLFASKLTLMEIGLKFPTHIPTAICMLTALVKIDLSDSKLFGSIPQEIGSLVNLVVLSLHGNQLDGCIPESIGNLKNLQRLFLQNNSLTGSIPAVLGTLTSLKSLLLSQNQFSGVVPTELENLTNLEVLFLVGNSFDEKPALHFQEYSVLTDFPLKSE
ncbi:L domain-like protein [Rhizoclosmatium globosum]|uniref:L domain-like protein n=1 Tax=Rhizoclosmatium globosum TaxID=329046 RepID=A0A1Y2CE76_9FUNG|nr:L domain-like protein [Rhizoclosmatium globosum]|eukprot:ORY45349.1 L domain-like protein [Rhizoclosmatium globosum]